MTVQGPQQDRRAGALPAAQLPRPRGRLGAAVIEFDASGLDSASLRSAGKELLSLALIDARNHTLRWATALEAAADGAALALPADLPATLAAELDPALWTLGHIGWFQEYWIARNVQRGRGERADPTQPRLASIVPEADAWYDPAAIDRSRRRELAIERAARPAGDARVPGRHARDDARAARRHRRRGRRLALLPSPRALPRGDARRGVRGAGADARHRRQGRAGGAHRDAAAAAAAVLSGDALAARLERRRLSLRQRGRAASGRRARVRDRRAGRDLGAVRRVRRGRRLRRARALERWTAGTGCSAKAGARRATSTRCATASCSGASACSRASPPRIPPSTSAGTRPTPGAAGPAGACRAKSSGRRPRTRARRAAFAGATCTSGRRRPSGPIPGFVAGPWRDYSLPAFGAHKVLRGASFATRPSLRSARLRGFAPAERDDGFFGFRSCAA